MTVDIVFLKKQRFLSYEPWLKTKSIRVNGNKTHINEYHLKHPTHVLGNLAVVRMYQRQGLTCQLRKSPYNLLFDKLNIFK